MIVQDPVWEQSFPPVESTVVPVTDAGGDRLLFVQLTRRETEARRAAHEQRLADVLAELIRFGLDPFVLLRVEPRRRARRAARLGRAAPRAAGSPSVTLPPYRTLVAVGLAVAIAAVAVAIVVVYAPGWRDGGDGPHPLTAKAAVEPGYAQFGDVVTLRTHVVADRRALDSGSVDVDARFTPFRPLSSVTQRPRGRRRRPDRFRFPGAARLARLPPRGRQHRRERRRPGDSDPVARRPRRR